MSNPIRKSFSEPNLTRLNQIEAPKPDDCIARSILNSMNKDSELSGRKTPPFSTISRIFTEDIPVHIDAQYIQSKGCRYEPFSSQYFPSLEDIIDKYGPDKRHSSQETYRLNELQQNPLIPQLGAVQAQVARDYRGMRFKIFSTIKDKLVQRNQYQIAEIGMNQEESRRFAEVLSRKIEECGFKTDEEIALVLDRCHQAIFTFVMTDPERNLIEGGTADGNIPSEIEVHLQNNSVVILGHSPAITLIEIGEVPNTSVIRDGRVFIHVKKEEDEIKVDLLQTAVATPLFAFEPQSKNRVYFPSPTREELNDFRHPVVNLKDMEPEDQIRAVNSLLEQGRLSLKLNGVQITNLNQSHFKKFSEQIKKELLHATFVNFGFDQVDMSKITSPQEIEKKLFKPVEINWTIPDKFNVFLRQASAIQLTPYSPINPTKINITGK